MRNKVLKKVNLPSIVFFNDGFDWEIKGNRYYLPYYYSFKTKVLVVSPHLGFIKTLKKLFKNEPFLRKIKKNLYFFQPPGLIPLNRSFWLFKNGSYLVSLFFIKKTMRSINIERKKSIFYFFYPEYFKTALKLKPKLKIYHLVDLVWEYPFYYPYKKDRIRAEKLSLSVLRESDLVFTSSLYLFKEVKNINKKTFLLENGTDMDLIQAELRKEAKRPKIIEKTNKPIIGFIGNMSSFRFDFSLLKYLVENIKDFNFILIGSGKDNQKNLKTLSLKNKNCHYLGEWEFKKAIKYLKYFDVGIIPYKKNSYTRGVLPIKLFDYFSFGMPVVSTNLYSLKPFKDELYLEANKKVFLLAIKKALKEKSKTMRKKRIKIAKNHSWRNIVEKSEKITRKHL
ncbi:hypothetical protein COT75_01350 [Candidatus Beckwithbacteria bacterium CG10_big_fil_rev_8_21_14_0_10_34_10]|uniref:Glycosyl transferase family 1 domain-containing protein n=1 Tax=Candidatus Beckwithbacteria bacterium CG10_big_fil_rev_8_21_14_0_10_34_10 TaxID=1974495 RepID=A0A2H0WA36_9BACT|nr:MAG: hypothetical protein COT75_01350 [Candidatus Beckwithbacteria bacterium CG10_big_fil_rev_8_21_14_0_10_34_10]